MASEALQFIIDMFRAMTASRPSPSVDEMRDTWESLASQVPAAPDLRVEQVLANGVPAAWFVVPEAAADRAVLYLHGGAYVAGSLNTHRDLITRVGRAARARVLGVEYRLAPEDPFPAAVNDAVAAWRWLVSPTGGGVAPRRAAIAGDSAGGGLTVATLVSLRQSGDPLPAAAACLSPWVDLEGIGPSMTARAALDPIVSRDNLVRMGRHYLGGKDPRTPLAAPLYADLTGLPPLLVQVGTAEALWDDAGRLAERARAAGVDVTLEPWEDMIHAFQAFASVLPEGQQAITRLGEFIVRHTA
ncbi:MAG TPA: alpha/beta hydrolase [Myxococcota bacterium]|nr:alpha/beta hydrolase [Myxococcota bacterium]